MYYEHLENYDFVLISIIMIFKNIENFASIIMPILVVCNDDLVLIRYNRVPFSARVLSHAVLRYSQVF